MSDTPQPAAARRAGPADRPGTGPSAATSSSAIVNNPPRRPERVASLMRARNFNIESLRGQATSTTRRFSRMTITPAATT